jgi:hypothetical protein
MKAEPQPDALIMLAALPHYYQDTPSQHCKAFVAMGRPLCRRCRAVFVTVCEVRLSPSNPINFTCNVFAGWGCSNRKTQILQLQHISAQSCGSLPAITGYASCGYQSALGTASVPCLAPLHHERTRGALLLQYWMSSYYLWMATKLSCT